MAGFCRIMKEKVNLETNQIKINTTDIDLLGLKVDNHYFLDLLVPFGFRHGSKIFQRCTDAVPFTMKQHGFPNL